MSIRIGAPETIQREYLPRLLKAMRRRFPELSFTLIAARLEQIEASCSRRRSTRHRAATWQAPEGIKQKELVRVPMALVVPERAASFRQRCFGNRTGSPSR